MVPKTDEIYISVSIITFHLFYVLCQKKVLLLKISKVRETLEKLLYHYAKVIENATINFSISPYCTLLFSRKENFKCFEVALSEVLCNAAIGCIINV